MKKKFRFKSINVINIDIPLNIVLIPEEFTDELILFEYINIIIMLLLVNNQHYKLKIITGSFIITSNSRTSSAQLVHL